MKDAGLGTHRYSSVLSVSASVAAQKPSRPRYEAGVNFFFLSSDLHWPLYEATRKGLANLLASGRAKRDDIVVAACSYLDQPLFGALQFHEVIDAIPGLKRIDVVIAGGVSHPASYYTRLPSLQIGKMFAYRGISAIGASFHDRQCALAAQNANQIDIAYIRCNPAHPGRSRRYLPVPAPRPPRIDL